MKLSSNLLIFIAVTVVLVLGGIYYFQGQGGRVENVSEIGAGAKESAPVIDVKTAKTSDVAGDFVITDFKYSNFGLTLELEGDAVLDGRYNTEFRNEICGPLFFELSEESKRLFPVVTGLPSGQLPDGRLHITEFSLHGEGINPLRELTGTSGNAEVRVDRVVLRREGTETCNSMYVDKITQDDPDTESRNMCTPSFTFDGVDSVLQLEKGDVEDALRGARHGTAESTAIRCLFYYSGHQKTCEERDWFDASGSRERAALPDGYRDCLWAEGRSPMDIDIEQICINELGGTWQSIDNLQRDVTGSCLLPTVEN